MHYTAEELDWMAGAFVLEFLRRCHESGLPLSLHRATYFSTTGKTVDWAVDQEASRLLREQKTT